MAGKWKRYIAFGCPHGNLADKYALDTVAKAIDRYKPSRRVHLGDACDYAAFRAGAGGTKDEALELDPDLHAGIKLIERFEPTDLLIGNHDKRVWKACNHQNAILAKAARAIRTDFLSACTKNKVKVIDHYDINRSWITLGDTKFLHGFMYGEQALRDHAEHFGRCVIAHLHKPGSMRGRRCDHPAAYCVGTLANIGMMDYAETRRSTATWAHGFAWGEYSDTECTVNISEQQPGQDWRLPF